MSTPDSDKKVPKSDNEYSLCRQAGHFSVSFRSPYNSIHQISGLKTEDEAYAWIAQTKLLVEKYT